METDAVPDAGDPADKDIILIVKLDTSRITSI